MLTKLSYGPYLRNQEDIDVMDEMLEMEGGWQSEGKIIVDADANADSMIRALINLFTMMGYSKKVRLEVIVAAGKRAVADLKEL
jgi:hypothetical protein